MKSSLLLAALPLALAAPRPVLPVELGPQPYGSPDSSAVHASPNSPASHISPNSSAVTATVTATQYVIVAQLSGTTVVSTIHDYGTAAPGDQDPPAVTTTEYVMIAQLSETTFISTIHDYGTAVPTLGTAAPWNQDPPAVTTVDPPCTDLTTFVETTVVPLTPSSSAANSSAISSVVTLSTAISSAVTSSVVTSSDDIRSVIDLMTLSVTTTYVLTPDTTAVPTTIAPAPTVTSIPTTVIPTDDPLTTLVVVTVTTEAPTTEAPTTTAAPTTDDSAPGIVTIWPSSGLPYWEAPSVYCYEQPFVEDCFLTTTSPIYILAGRGATHTATAEATQTAVTVAR